MGLETRYASAWRHVAQRFATLPSVLGYELFNEPFPGSATLTCLGPAGCRAFDRELTTFNRLTAAAIRTVDRRTLILAEPNVLFDFGAPTDVGALDDPQAGFAFHVLRGLRSATRLRERERRAAPTRSPTWPERARRCC